MQCATVTQVPVVPEDWVLRNPDLFNSKRDGVGETEVGTVFFGVQFEGSLNRR